MRICTANPDRPPAIAAWIIFRRSAVSDFSRRAFMRSNWPCRALRLCIPFLLDRHRGNQFLKASEAEIMVAPSPQPPILARQKQRPATAF